MATKPTLIEFNRIGSLFVQEYERYLPTAFDESMTLLEKVNKIIQYCNEVGALTNGVIDKWNEVFNWIMNDGLTQAVVKRLQEMLEDGTLQNVINEEILGKKASIFVQTNEPVKPDSRTFWFKLEEDNQHVTMKERRGTAWGDFFPITHDTHVFDSANKPLSTKISEIYSQLDLRQKVSDLHFVNVVQYMNVKKVSFTQAFQEVLNIAKTVGGVYAIIPSGKYSLTTELKMYANTTIECASDTVLTRDHAGYMIMNGNRSSEADPSNYTGYNGRGNLTFIGGTWNGNGVSQPSKASIMHFGHSQNIVFNQVTFKDPANSHHVELNGCRGVHFEGCKFLGWVGTTDTFNEAIQLDNAKLGVTTIGSDDGTACRDIWIDNCYFGQSNTNGSNHIARAIGGHNSVIGKKHTNISITNCIIENTLSWAIRCYNWEDVTISNNIFKNCGAGINVRAAITGVDTEDNTGAQVGSERINNITITGNAFNRTKDAGRMIEIYGEENTSGIVYGVTIADNTIDMTGSVKTFDAITCKTARDLTVTGNRIYNAKGNGIVLADVFSATVNGNQMNSLGEDGINVTGSFYVTILGNTLNKMSLNGIYISAVEVYTISGNIIGGVNGANGSDPRNHIRVVSTSDRGVVTANVCRNFSTSHVTAMAIYITNTCKNTVLGSNNAVGFTISNSSTGGTTQPNGDLI